MCRPKDEKARAPCKCNNFTIPYKLLLQVVSFDVHFHYIDLSCVLIGKAVREGRNGRTFFFRFFLSGQYANGCGLYCERPVSRALNVPKVPASATIDGSWFQSLMDVNIVHVQSCDAV